MEILNEAKDLQPQLVADRRYLHKNAEIGFELPKTTEYIQRRLRELGLSPQPCGRAGIVAEIGKGQKCFLLRADMDALPIRERSGEPFAAKNGHMHACGHDMHAAMLLGAAAILKKHESELNGRLRLLFQPAEEILEGAQDCVNSGVLDGVDGAMMLHVLPIAEYDVGTLIVSDAGVSAPAADFFDVKVQGKGCHGSSPWQGVDALLIGARVVEGVLAVAARELSPFSGATLTFGRFVAGEADNALAEKALLSGTLRALDEKTRAYYKDRLETITKGIARSMKGRARVVYKSGCPCLNNDEGLAKALYEACLAALGEKKVLSASQLPKGGVGGSEDFAYIAQRVPSIMAGLCAGVKKNRQPLHSPSLTLNEACMPYGVAAFCLMALCPERYSKKL